MKRTHGLILAMAAVAFAATTALADDPQSTPASSPAPATTSAPAKSMHHAKAAAKTPKTDINSASKEDLMKLPGVDDATADKIIAARPFKTRTELVSKNILTSAQFSKVRMMVAAMPAPKSASK